MVHLTKWFCFALKIFPLFCVSLGVLTLKGWTGATPDPSKLHISRWFLTEYKWANRFRHPQFFLWPESRSRTYWVTRYGETAGIKAAEKSDPERRAICSQVWFSLTVKRLSRGLQSWRLMLGVACLAHVTTSNQQLKPPNDISRSGQRNPLPQGGQKSWIASRN